MLDCHLLKEMVVGVEGSKNVLIYKNDVLLCVYESVCVCISQASCHLYGTQRRLTRSPLGQDNSVPHTSPQMILMCKHTHTHTHIRIYCTFVSIYLFLYLSDSLSFCLSNL